MDFDRTLLRKYWTKKDVQDYILDILENLYLDRVSYARPLAVRLLEGVRSLDEHQEPTPSKKIVGIKTGAKPPSTET
jgi:hypothetical protein